MSEIFHNGRKGGKEGRKGEIEEDTDLDRPGLTSLL